MRSVCLIRFSQCQLCLRNLKTLKRLFLIAVFGLLLQSTSVQGAKYFNYISYPCADWGPDLEAKEPDKADEVIYFIKKIDFGGEASVSKVPVASYGDVSWHDAKWGESPSPR
jgi:hypothetical protein